jgi:hypothetical protein
LKDAISRSTAVPPMDNSIVCQGWQPRSSPESPI